MRGFFVSLVAAAMFFGCTQKHESVQVKEYMPWAHAKVSNIALQKGVKVAKIRNVTSQKSYLGSEMWYQKTGERAPFAYSRWAMPPSVAVATALEESLDNSAIFKSVLSSHSLSASDFIIELSIADFYQDFSREGSDAVLSVKLTLLATASGKVAASKRFEYRQKCDTDDAYGGVAAFKKLFERFGEDAKAWISAEVNHAK